MRIAEAQLARAIHELAISKTLSLPVLSQSVRQFLWRKRLTKRMGKFLRVLEAYEEEMAQLVTVKASTAHKLTAEAQHVIQQKAASLFGSETKTTHVTFHTDPTLLGGVRLETRDRCYDFSLKRSLDEVRKSFSK